VEALLARTEVRLDLRPSGDVADSRIEEGIELAEAVADGVDARGG